MHRLRRRLAEPSDDAGFTLIEVMVALMVFAIASTGLIAGSIAITRITGDSRARQVATQLAAKELDQARTAANPRNVLARTYTDSTTDPTHTFTIVRTVASVTAAGADTACGDNANFAYRRVSVTVSWPGQLSTTQAVRSDSILAPAAPSTDAGTGAISVRVIGSDGTPRSGVGVTVAPVPGGGGEVLTSQPASTDSDGCTYADRVVPGTYTIKLSKTDYIDTTQAVTPSSTTTVTAGATSGVRAEYNLEANFITKYAKNYTGPGTPLLPTNLKTSFVPNLGALNIAIMAAVADDTVPLYPGGYEAVAGEFSDAYRNTSCASMDPVQWQAGTVGTRSMAQGVRATASALSGQTDTFRTPATASIPMGVVKVTGVPGVYITAQSATAVGTGNPGCDTPPATLTYARVDATGTAYLALPFGSWGLYQGTILGLLSLQVPAASTTVLTNNDSNGVTTTGAPGLGLGLGSSSGLGLGLLGSTTVTLDPRLVAP